ncbi:hypothetical protein [Marinibactrum halimedae]|uniref:Peptidase M61 catalytic domain-containing protein n=1 Tax=Marinibactrum halimedae TaxID=1444977 RepID=A0AA37T5L5_9GAMM|nr:hypothetical protein [Marinibactrum halimedae]MCD9459651.1 hypothetical protein [Marinibactrum halimedae]GLS25678.1 hypothetical protein GCM10007877_13920 [Marinibactrum halimedae]
MVFVILIISNWVVASGVQGKSIYPVHYNVILLPEKDLAKVKISIEKSHLVKSITFRLDPDVFSHLEANGELTIKNNRAKWTLPKKNAELTLEAKLTHERDPGEFDALVTKDWAIFRGDDLIPPASVKAKKGAQSQAYLSFELPQHWPSVNTGWQRDEKAPLKDNQTLPPHFIIDDPERKFDRPTGWMIAGKVGTRASFLGKTRIDISAPMGESFHRMDALAFINIVWPHAKAAFSEENNIEFFGPDKLLILGAGDPMWRGGLSASNSFFMHADRPLVSENGTSTLVHELVHMLTRIKAKGNADWIVEGIAEFYAVELLYRAGAYGKDRRDIVYSKLKKWGKEAKTLNVKRSSGPVTAKAVVLLDKVDQEIRKKTDNQFSLDHVTRKLIEKRKITVDDLKKACHELVGEPCASLNNIP